MHRHTHSVHYILCDRNARTCRPAATNAIRTLYTPPSNAPAERKVLMWTRIQTAAKTCDQNDTGCKKCVRVRVREISPNMFGINFSRSECSRACSRASAQNTQHARCHQTETNSRAKQNKPHFCAPTRSIKARIMLQHCHFARAVVIPHKTPHEHTHTDTHTHLKSHAQSHARTHARANEFTEIGSGHRDA